MRTTKDVFLIGFSGSGKSSIGRELARLFRVPFLDTDDLIQKRDHRTIAEIFEHDGEAHFRQLESETIRQVISGYTNGKVVALGGGAFEDMANRDLVNSAGVSVYLSCSVRDIYRRLALMTDRPLLRVSPVRGQTGRQARMARIRQLLKARARNYAQADIRYATSGKEIRVAAKELYRRLKEYYAENTD